MRRRNTKYGYAVVKDTLVALMKEEPAVPVRGSLAAGLAIVAILAIIYAIISVGW